MSSNLSACQDAECHVCSMPLCSNPFEEHNDCHDHITLQQHAKTQDAVSQCRRPTKDKRCGHFCQLLQLIRLLLQAVRSSFKQCDQTIRGPAGYPWLSGAAIIRLYPVVSSLLYLPMQCNPICAFETLLHTAYVSQADRQCSCWLTSCRIRQHNVLLDYTGASAPSTEVQAALKHSGPWRLQCITATCVPAV